MRKFNNKVTGANEGTIKIKKDYAFNKDIKLKVAVVCYVKLNAWEIDAQLLVLLEDTIKHVFYDCIEANERLILINANEVTNAKA